MIHNNKKDWQNTLLRKMDEHRAFEKSYRSAPIKLVNEIVQQIPAGPGGGHICWKVTTGTDAFFIKQLDPKLNAADENIIAHYELCELVAFRFLQQGIPAVHANKNYNNKYVTLLENDAYLVYPWIEGYRLNRVTTDHAVMIAEILANIHRINLDVPDLEPNFDIHTDEEIIMSFEMISTEAKVSNLLVRNERMILEINERYFSSIPILKEKTVVTHGDIFPHNVIWQSADQPYLIDWEAVKKWNPTREAVRACLAWGGVNDEPLSLSLFELMLNSYIGSGGLLEKNHVEAALNGMYGNTINWLLYNTSLITNSDNQTNTNAAVNEIRRSFELIAKFTKLYPTLYTTIMNVLK